MIATLAKLFDLLSPRERGRLVLLLGLVLLSGFAEMIGVASILPFLAVLADPGVIETNPYLAWAYAMLGFTSTQAFLTFLGMAVLGFVLFSLAVRLVTAYAIARFSNMRAYTLSSRLIENYVRQPYTWFLDRNSAALGKIILTEVDRVVRGAMVPAVRLLSRLAIVLALFGLLLVIEPVAALAAALLFGGSYVLIYLGVRSTLARLGDTVLRANYYRYKIAQESLAGIKDVKVLGVEDAFLRQFRSPSRKMARAKALGTVIGEVPRYILETVAIGGTLVFILVMMASRPGGLAEILPTLGLFAFAGVRLFPALQSLYAETTSLRMTQSAVEELHRDMMATRAGVMAGGAAAAEERLRLRERLELAGIDYAYPSAERPALRGLDLSIAARSTVGIVGGTGAGKTTMVDLILGLLEPQAGELRIDGVPVTRGTLRSWQRNIGYVPQAIFLSDDSIAANIAFGVPQGEIDQAAVERAAGIAELHGFVTGELPQGYATLVGERGVRLSGGQRQRIGIARALYHDPDVLVLDEATSALDNLTERAVMDAVHNLGHAKTIIMIAHRLTTVRACDTIFMMEAGRVIAQGSYEDLLDTSENFRAMAEIRQ